MSQTDKVEIDKELEQTVATLNERFQNLKEEQAELQREQERIRAREAAIAAQKAKLASKEGQVEERLNMAAQMLFRLWHDGREMPPGQLSNFHRNNIDTVIALARLLV